MPKISVLMSVYNGDEYLEEAIDSVLSQTFRDFEFIIINDGSSDMSLAILKDYEKKDSRIRLISRENKGLIVSLNEGLAIAQGKYIARMDADDICHPERLEKQYEMMEKNEEVVVCGSSVIVFGDNVKTSVSERTENHFYNYASLIFEPPLAHPTAMIRTKTLRENGICYEMDFKDAEDYALWVRLAEFGQIVNLHIPLLRYRIRDGGITKTADRDKSGKRYQIISHIQHLFLEKIGFPESKRNAKVHFSVSSRDKVNGSEFSYLGFSNYLADLSEFINSSGKKSLKYADIFIARKYFAMIIVKLKAKEKLLLYLLKDRNFYRFLFIYIAYGFKKRLGFI